LLSPSEVSAVIVTKGDVDLTPVIRSSSLIFPLICVYNNSTEDTDQMTYGRVVAAQRAPTDVIWSQDDDIIHTPEAQREIVAAYEPGVLTGCMWPEWSAGAKEQGIENGYDDLVFPGSGSISDVKVWEDAVSVPRRVARRRVLPPLVRHHHRRHRPNQATRHPLPGSPLR
jgi:hypothetical protein